MRFCLCTVAACLLHDTACALCAAIISCIVAVRAPDDVGARLLYCGKRRRHCSSRARDAGVSLSTIASHHTFVVLLPMWNPEWRESSLLRSFFLSLPIEFLVMSLCSLLGQPSHHCHLGAICRRCADRSWPAFETPALGCRPTLACAYSDGPCLVPCSIAAQVPHDVRVPCFCCAWSYHHCRVPSASRQCVSSQEQWPFSSDLLNVGIFFCINMILLQSVCKRL